MKCFKLFITEKLKITKQNNNLPAFDGIKPESNINFNIFVKTLKKYGYKNGNYYSLNKIYGDDENELPKSKISNNAPILGIYVSNDDFCIVFVFRRNDNLLSNYEVVLVKHIAEVLGKGDINKGFGVIKYIIDDINKK